MQSRRMIEGRVHPLPGPLRTGEIRVVLAVANYLGVFHDFEFILDTGFDGHLTLPRSAVESLQLTPEGFGTAELADSEFREFRFYRATVLWNGRHREIGILQTETRPPLLGMAMLWGSRLSMEAREGGIVAIEDLAEV